MTATSEFPEITQPMIEAAARAIFNLSHPPGIDWWAEAAPSTKRSYFIRAQVVLQAVLSASKEDDHD